MVGKAIPSTLMVMMLFALLGGGTQNQLKADTNQAPVVSASSLTSSIDLLQALEITATVSDDGLPTGELTYAWTKVSGPGEVGFADHQAKNTTVAFSKAGSYVIRLTVSDGEFSTTSDVSVTANTTIAFAITNLGTLGGSSIEVAAINNRGYVVGQSSLSGDTQTHAFIWSGGTMTDLGTLGGDDSAALGINNGSYVVGESVDLSDETHAFLWDGTTMSDLGTYPDTTGTETTGYGIDDLGYAVGIANESTTPAAVSYDGFTWSDLGTLGGSWAVAKAINIRNQIVGQSEDGASASHPFFMMPPGSMTQIDPLGATSGGTALAINDFGEWVGQATNASSQSHAFLYKDSEGSDLGTLGGTTSIAYDINNLGDVVGSAQDGSSIDRAFVYYHGVMIDLNDLIDSSSGWTILSEAKSINDAGQIVGHGTISSQTRGFILTPLTAQFNILITVPDDQTDYDEGDNITFHAVAAKSDDTISKVSFYEGSNLLGEDTVAPYSLVWSNPAIGSYEITCVATAADASTVTSDIVNVTVLNVNDPPSATITEPLLSGLRYPAGADIKIVASATDPDGDETIAKIEYYQGTTKLGETTEAPHRLIWSSVSPGDYSLTAVAVDSEGLTGTSSPVLVKVNTIPSTDMALWLRSDAGIELDASGYVKKWQNQADGYGTGLKLIQNTASARPALVSGQLNGMPAIRFDGIDDALSYAIANPYSCNSTLHIIFKSNDSSPASGTTYFTTSDWGNGEASLSSYELRVDQQSTPQLSVSDLPFAPIPDSYSIHTIQIDGTTMRCYLNGAIQAEFTINEISFQRIADYVLGVSGQNSSLYASCDIVEVIVYVSSQSNQDIADTVDALAKEYALNQAPHVSWDSPAINTPAVVGQSIPLTVSSHDPDGTVTQVEFFANDVSIGYGTQSGGTDTYILNWTPTTNDWGEVKLYAKATDDDSINSLVTQSFNTSVIVANSHDILATGEIVAPDSSTDGNGKKFGRAVSIDGNFAFVGDARYNANTGVVYVYQKVNGSWSDTPVARLRPTLDDGVTVIGANVYTYGNFGAAVSVKNGMAIVGEPDREDPTSTREGFAYIYRLDTQTQTWNMVKRVKGSSPSSKDFGCSVAIESNTAVVGDSNGGIPGDFDRLGAVDIFEKSYLSGQEEWVGVKRVVSDANMQVDGSGADNGYLGYAVTIDHNRILMGGIQCDSVVVYEKTLDEWQLAGYITSEDSNSASSFGWSLGLSGDYAIIGSKGYLTSAMLNDGSAYIFKRLSNGSWVQVNNLRLETDGYAAGEEFGVSVAMNGNLAVVGMPGKEVSGQETAGTAYVYELNDGQWQQMDCALYAVSFGFESPIPGQRFGAAVALSDSDIIVGAPFDDNTANANKLAYIFDSGFEANDPVYITIETSLTPDSTGTVYGSGTYLHGSLVNVTAVAQTGYYFDHWTGDIQNLKFNGVDFPSAYLRDPVIEFDADQDRELTAVFVAYPAEYKKDLKLLASDSNTGDQLGFTVAVDGDWAVAGAPYNDDLGANAGAAYVYHWDGTHWYEVAKLQGLDTDESDEFGCSVAISGDRIVIGADKHNGTGAVYVFEYDQTSWNQTAKLDNPIGGNSNDKYGISVAVSGDRIAVGATLYNAPNSSQVIRSNSGAAFVYDLNGTTWEETRVLPDDVYANVQFGVSLALENDRLVVGTHLASGAISGTGLAYVFDLDTTWYESAILEPGDGSSGDRFGWSVDLSGNRVVVGAPYHHYNGLGDSGAAYAFKFNGSTWSLDQKLTADTDAAANDHYGSSVTISGDKIAIGSHDDDDNQSASGSIYVYHLGESQWDLQTKIMAFDAVSGDHFGFAVNMGDNELVVGALGVDDNGVDAGALYAYQWDGFKWNCDPFPFLTYRVGQLTASDAQSGDKLGYAVAVSSFRMVVGAPYDDDDTNGTAAGTVYIYEWDGQDWQQVDRLIASDGIAGDYFGYSVAIDGDRIVVGAINATGDTTTDTGAVYIFDWDGSDWNQTDKLFASNGVASDNFGVSVDVDGLRVLVGANQTGALIGSAYLYEWNDVTSQWQVTIITASDRLNNDRYGQSVAMDGDRILIGAWSDDHMGGLGGDAGAAYLYEWDGSAWNETKFAAADSTPGAYYGYSVSLSADRLAIGAPRDSENGTNAGAVYVYDWDGEHWNETKLGNSIATAGDLFGYSVGVSMDRLVVGSPYNDDQSISAGGTAYLFNWDGSQWQDYPSLTNGLERVANDLYGWSVAVHGERIAVGVIGDDSSRGSAFAFMDMGLTSVTTITTVAPVEFGSVTGGGEFDANDTVTLTATPQTHCEFVGWQGELDGLDIADTASTTISFKAGNYNRTIYAVFIPDPTVSMVTPISNGSVSGTGQYAQGDPVTLVATADSGYVFKQWGSQIYGVSYNSTDLTVWQLQNETITFDSDFSRVLTAEFIVITEHTITATATNGSVTGAGTYDYGQTATLVATPAPGYHFVQWTGDVSDLPAGDLANSGLSFRVTGDRTLVAEIEAD